MRYPQWIMEEDFWTVEDKLVDRLSFPAAMGITVVSAMLGLSALLSELFPSEFSGGFFPLIETVEMCMDKALSNCVRVLEPHVRAVYNTEIM